MELALAVMILVALIASWVVLPSEKDVARREAKAPAAARATQQA